MSRAVVIGTLICVLGVSSCTDVESNTSQSPSATSAATSLPLQAQALAIGGDVQSRATDVVRVRLSPRQLKALANACKGSVEVATKDCRETIKEVIKYAMPLPDDADGCPPGAACLVVSRLNPIDVPSVGNAGYGVILDNTPKSVCLSAPNHQCIGVGIKSASVLDGLAATAKRLQSIGTPPPITSSTPTETGSPTESPDPEATSPEPSETSTSDEPSAPATPAPTESP
jgi:hypothetical protein